MRLLVRLLAFVTLLILSYGTAVPLGAEDMSPFEAMDTGCHDPIDGTFVVDADGVLHIRGDSFSGIVESDEPLLAGTSQVVFNADIDLATGIGTGWGTVTVDPTAFDGTWQITIGGKFTPTKSLFVGSGFGTGDLEGMQIAFDARNVDVDHGRRPPACQPHLDHTRLRGTIRS